jgi:hypothetical protein
MVVADDAGPSIVGLERRVPGEELGHFGRDRLLVANRTREMRPSGSCNQ